MLAGCCVLILLLAGCRATSYAKSQASYAPRNCDAELYALGLYAAETRQLAEQGRGYGATLGLQRQRQQQCADFGGAKRTRPPLASRDPPRCRGGDPRRERGRPMATVKKKMATMKPMATVKKRSRRYGRLERSERLACGTRDACSDGVATPTAMTWLKPRDVDPQLHDSSIAAVAFEWKGESERKLWHNAMSTIKR